MDKRLLLVLPIAAFAVLGGVGYVAGMPKAAPMVNDVSVAIVQTASLTTASESWTPPSDVGTTPQLDQDWLLRTGAATGIPVRALQAYAAAAYMIGAAQPECNLGWNTLAAIGDVESGHGSHGGAQLDENGVADPAILGPVLDGRGTAAIRDTDRGALDGDVMWDRAVGPLQFIPDTWARHGVDADGDGEANPHDIDDAALTAAAYLCHAGDLSTAEGWVAAVFSYNHLDSYVEAVRERAATYAELSAQ